MAVLARQARLILVHGSARTYAHPLLLLELDAACLDAAHAFVIDLGPKARQNRTLHPIARTPDEIMLQGAVVCCLSRVACRICCFACAADGRTPLHHWRR